MMLSTLIRIGQVFSFQQSNEECPGCLQLKWNFPALKSVKHCLARGGSDVSGGAIDFFVGEGGTMTISERADS